MAITSDEVNYLVYRYLQESGFMHSAFTFAYESQLAKTNVISTELPPGALVSFIQKGLQFVGIEAHINEDGTERECEGEITLLSPHICRVAQSATSSARSLLPSSSSSSKISNKRKRKVMDGVVYSSSDGITSSEGNKEIKNGVLNTTSEERNEQATDPSMVVLRGHVKEVYGCLWNPCYNLLVSGSSDSTARIWEMDAIESKTNTQPSSISLAHGTGSHKDVTTMEWNHDGNMLATGTYNGKTRIWTREGEMKHVFQYHNGPVFATRWSRTSCYLLSASFDKTVALWDIKNETKQQIKLHDEPILDASWKDDEIFATCSADRRICITRVGATESEVVLRGHSDAINSIKWDPSGRLIASCSDDYTVKLWDPFAIDRNNGSIDHGSEEDEKKKMYLHSFQEHKKEVYTFRWSTTGPGSNGPNGPLTLASASFDTTVKLWDVESLTCLQTFEHQHPVYGVSYSPNGEYLASGTIGGKINIWSLKTGSLLKSYQANGDIYEVNWSKDGDFLSACASSGDVVIIHFRL